jgi:hypothetical protein
LLCLASLNPSSKQKILFFSLSSRSSRLRGSLKKQIWFTNEIDLDSRKTQLLTINFKLNTAYKTMRTQKIFRVKLLFNPAH